MVHQHTHRLPVTHRTMTTSQRLRHKQQKESGLDWGGIAKVVFFAATIMLAAFLVTIVMG